MKIIEDFGPLMINVEGLKLSAEDKEVLANPLVGGFILFARNYQSPEQLRDLCCSVREAAKSPILIAVDHEGGRVQRFGEPFTKVPAMRSLGIHYDHDHESATRLAYDIGWLIAAELGEFDIDFSFTPVLDIDYGINEAAIGSRSLHRDPNVVAHLAASLIDGLRSNGMAAVGKHFPGHGGVAVDSHVGIPVDERAEATLMNSDGEPFRSVCKSGIAGMMPAHVIYSQLDPHPAGFSSYWLNTVLREQLGFDGAIFSDDLSMQAAHSAGDVVSRVSAAARAGCDMLLVCNVHSDVDDVLAKYTDRFATRQRSQRLAAMQLNRSLHATNERRLGEIKDRLRMLEEV